MKKLLPALAILAVFAAPATGYIEVPYSLGRLVAESTNIVVLQVEKVDKENNRILYKKIRDVKGTHPSDVLLHNIGKAGFHPREWQNTMAWAEPAKIAVFMYNGNASETCIDMYWYQAYGGGKDWGMSHAEPFLLRSFAGRPEKLVMAIEEIMAGKEVVVPAMMDGDKNAIQLRTAKVQRLRASLKLNDYNAARDFIGWGSEDFRRISFMPGFSHMASLTRVDPDARGVAATDVDGDGDTDLCLYGEKKVILVQPDGGALNEMSLPVTGGARGASFADWNGDGKADLLLACPEGAKLLTNLGTSFKDDSGMLPKDAYSNVTAAAWIDFDADGKPDVLVANGFNGLRLLRNPASAAAVVPKNPAYGPWYFIGGFNEGDNFSTVFPPEKEIKLDAKYKARGGVDVGWVKKEWPDGAVHDFLAHNPQPLHENVANYITREIDAPTAAEVTASFGSDDTLTVWINGKQVHAENVGRGAAPDQAMVKLPLKQGKNQLLVKICNGGGPSGFYFSPKAPEVVSGPPFEDWTAKAGLGPDGRAGNVKGDHLLVADFNGDGRQDAFYAAAEGVLLLNTPTGFLEARPLTGVRMGGVVPAAGDVDGDKDLDLVIPLAKGVKIFRNDGKGAFADAGGLPGFEGRATSAAFVDLGKKGAADLIIGCLGEPNRYFRNGGGAFTDASKEIGLDKRVLNSRLAAAADVNKDGVWDLVFNNEGQEPFILLGDPNK